MTEEPTPGKPLVQEPTPVPQPVAPPVKKKTIYVWVIVVVIVVVVCLLCGAGCSYLFGKNIVIAFTEKDTITQVCVRFMQAMEAGHTETAYALFSSRARRQIPFSELEELAQGNNALLFADYRSLDVVNLNVSTVVNSDPDIPQGLVANVQGILHYESGPDGSFTAILEKEDGVWMLDGFHVTISPERLNP